MERHTIVEWFNVFLLEIMQTGIGMVLVEGESSKVGNVVAIAALPNGGSIRVTFSYGAIRCSWRWVRFGIVGLESSMSSMSPPLKYMAYSSSNDGLDLAGTERVRSLTSR